MRKRIKLPPFLPDVLPEGSMMAVAKNVLPAVDGYRSVPGFVSISSALPDTFLGGASFVASDGGTYMLAGTATTLSRFTGGSWTSLASALTVSARWRFSQFGDFVVCVNGDTTQEVDLQAGTASDLAGAPTAIDVAVVGDFVVVAQPNGDRLRVRWSGFNDHTKWSNGVDQAGDQPMLTGGEVMGLAGGEYGVILQRNRIVRMTRTGDPLAPFQFDEISDNFGCASKASITQAGRTVFYLSDRGWAALDDGQAPRLIGNEKFDRTFRASLSPDDYERIWTAVDPENSLVMWGVPGSPGLIWAYNWALERAGTIEMRFDGMFAGFESSITLEGVDALYPGGIDTVPYSLDSPRFSGGAPRMYFVQDGEVGTLAGAKMKALIELGQFAPSGDQATRLIAVWPDTDAQGVSVTCDARQRRGDPEARRTGGSMQISGRVPVRANGRFMKIAIEIDDPDWTYITGVDIEGQAAGWRGA